MKYLLIREASINDAKELLEIYKPYVLNTAISFEYEVPSLNEFKTRIENTLKDYPYIVAIKDNKILGYAYASEFKGRKAYQYSVETSIYVKINSKREGIGKQLYLELEKILKKQGILNLNACIGYTEREDDDRLTNDSEKFHKALGYKLVGKFHKCGYKFGKWYDMIWMEKMIGNHNDDMPDIIRYSDIK